MSMLTVTFTNNSKVPSADVHIGFAPGSFKTDPRIVNLKDKAHGAIQVVNKSAGNGNWYTLENLSGGVGITEFSGRIYVCYGKPWTVTNQGYEPAQAIADPNFYLRYDKMELTFTGQAADVADLTSIDYWSIPMTLNARHRNKVVGTVNGFCDGATTQQVFDALSSLTAHPAPGPNGQPLPALVPGKFSKVSNAKYTDGPNATTTFARIIGPSSYPPVYPAPGGVPVMPYDLMKDYLKHLLDTFGPATKPDAHVKGLGHGVIAHIAGHFAGVGPDVPAHGSRSAQDYTLTASIGSDLSITLAGRTGTDSTKMVYSAQDLQNPSGIYGGNAPFSLNGAAKAAPANDVYGWIGGDLFSGLNIGAVGSTAAVGGKVVGGMKSSEWFSLAPTDFFARLQPGKPYYNQWAATLQHRSQAYNFAYTDRFAHVLVSLDPARVDTLEIVLDDATVKMS